MSALERAAEAWGQPLPDWVAALARAADQSSGVEAAKRVGISGSAVSMVLRRIYKGDYEAVAKRVRGTLLSEKLVCPVEGEIALNRCMTNQTSKGTANRARIRLSIACPNCPNRHRSHGGQNG